MHDNSTRLGVVALPVYGLLVFLSTLTHQPDYRTDFHAYAEYVTTTSFLVSHLVGSILGTTIGIFGVLALGAVLATSGERRRALRGLVLSVAGMAFIMALFGAAAFAQPAIGRAYLAGQQAAVAINSDLYGTPAVVVGVTGGLLYSAGAVLLGIAIWRAGTLPRWAGPLYAVAVPLIAVVGLAIGVAQPVGAMLLIISGAWIASTVWARPIGPRAPSQPHGSPPSNDPAGKTTDLDLKFVNNRARLRSTRLRLRPTASRRALGIIAVSLATLLTVAWPVAGSPTHAVVGSVAQPSPSDRADRVDFNGDGFDDLAIGAPGEGVGGAALAGAVNILYGGAGGLAGTNQLLTQGNPEAVDLFGFAVAKGDFNADGFTDLAVGAPSEDVGAVGLAGAVNVFYGSAAGLPAASQVRLQGNPEIGDRFGSALDAGLFNDDDFLDLAVGAPGETVGGRPDAGAVSVFYGSAAGLPAPSQGLFQGNPEQGDRFGAALVAGFFNADQGDLAVGAPGEDVATAGGAGAVSVFSGAPGGLSVASQVLLQTNPEVGDQFGLALAAGFFSGSIFNDLAVGAPTETVGTSADAGAVSVFFGSAIQLSGAAGQTLVQGPGVGGSAEAGDQFGSALAAGPFDAGPSDLAIGAPFEDLGATTDAGAVNVVYGSNTGLVGRGQALTQNSPGVVGNAESGDLFGAALARGIFLNNFNGDDFADLAIGAPGEDVGTAADAGAVNVQYGSATGLPGPGGQLFTQHSPGVGGSAESGDGFGAALD